MRITIETGVTPHAIKVEGEYTIDELLEFLGNQYPDGTWKDLKVCDTLPDSAKVGEGLWQQINPGNKQIWNTGNFPIRNPEPNIGVTYKAGVDPIYEETAKLPKSLADMYKLYQEKP